MSLIILQQISTIESGSLIKSFLDYGVIGSLVIFLGIFAYKQFISNKAELKQKDKDHVTHIQSILEAHKLEREELVKKMDEARKDCLELAKDGNLQVLGIANRFNEMVNDIRITYSNKNG